MDELEQISTRYLLGELSEQEQAAFEERYFRDPQVFNRVSQVENDLVDAYARGQLSEDMRLQFENSYLKHPSRRNRVEFAESLTTRIDERERSVKRAERSSQSTSQISWVQRLLALISGRSLRFAMALVIVLIALAGVWILVNTRGRQQQREAAQHGEPTTTQPTSTPEQTEKEQRASRVPPETSQPSPTTNKSPAPSTVSLALTVGGVRGANVGATPTLVIPHDTTKAQILLDLKDDSYPHYRASLRKIDGAEIFTQSNISPRKTKVGARFVFIVQAKQLTSGDYTLTLSGITPEGGVDDLSKSLFRVLTQ